MTDQFPPNADPAALPPDDVRDAFLETLDGEDESVDARIAERAELVLAQRPLATDAQAYAIALANWAVQDLLPVLDARAVGLPRAANWDGVAKVVAAVGPLAEELCEEWQAAYSSRSDPSQLEWSTYYAFERTKAALQELQRIPKYRLTDPRWKAKRPRPTPASLCNEAARHVGWAFCSALEAAPDAEWALDRLGLAPADGIAAERSARARRALAAEGFRAPGARLVSFAETLASVVDASPRGEPHALARGALATCADRPAHIAAEDLTLASSPLAGPAASIDDAAETLIVNLGATLVPLLVASMPARAVRTEGPSESTPVETPALRPSPEDLAARLVRSLRQGRRTPAAAVAELRTLVGSLSEATIDAVIQAVTASVLHRADPYSSALDHARIFLGAVDGPLLVPLRLVSRNRTHLWESGPYVEPDGDRFSQALCAAALDNGRVERLSVRPRVAVGGRDIFGRHFRIDDRESCGECERIARERDLLIAAVPAPVPAHLVSALRDAALGADPEDEYGDRSLWWRLREVIESSAAQQAVADAARLGEVCAQRILGPSRYLRERSAFADGRITAALTTEDWAAIARVQERSLARTLLDRAKDRRRA
jgi:hypothetical protein